MFVRKLALFAFCLLGFAVSSANAQSEARIRVVIPSIDQAEDDLKWMIEELAPTADLKKQWKRLKEDILDAFTQGVDLSKPASIDLVFRKDELSNEMRIPIKDLAGKKAGFLANLAGMGYTVKATPAGGTLYEISEPKKKPFYLRYDKNYGWIYTVKNAVPANPPLATVDMQPLLALQKDVVAELKNDAKGLEKRREDFKELRKQFESLIKARRNEDPNAFELRKLALTQQLNEAERFIVETEHLLASWATTSTGSNPSGRGEFSLTALPGTDLEKSVEEFAVKPSYFANVTLHKEPLVTGRMTFPLDSIRKTHVKEFYKSVRPALDSEISKRPGKTDDQKAAMKQATKLFLDILDAGAELGVLDSFIDSHPVTPGKNVLICGIRATDGKAVDEILKLLPKIKAEWKVELDSEEHGGVSIHKLTVPASRLESFQKVFSGETFMYVGTCKDAVWGSAGVDAVKHLKEAIDQAAQPAPEKVDPVVISYQIQVAKLVTLMEILEKEGPQANAKPSKEEAQRQKDLEKFRKLAQAAMGDCNSLMHGELKRNGNKIEGFLELNECVLKYVGSIIADGVKQLQ